MSFFRTFAIRIHTNTEHEENKSTKKIIHEKEAEIREPKGNLSKANFMIAFLQQENRQLKVNQLLLSKPEADLVAEDDKGKAVIYVDQLEDRDVQMKPRRPKMRISKTERTGK